jgi:hypothetical protein
MSWTVSGDNPSETIARLEVDGNKCPACGQHLSWNVRGSWDALRETHCSCGFSAEYANDEHMHHPKHPDFGRAWDYEKGQFMPRPRQKKEAATE